MPTTALLFVIVAAFAHSTWNLLAKRAAHNIHLIWFSSVAEALLFGPVAVWLVIASWPELSLKAGLFLLATGILHVVYTESLIRGYRVADFSIVYPLARGTGPFLAFFGAVFAMHEHLTLLAAAGAALITLGILIVSGGIASLARRSRHEGVLWGIATGCVIASYTLVDAYSVKTLLVPPLLVEYSGNLFRAIVLSGSVKRYDASLLREFRSCWKEALGIGLLTPLGYVLALSAMRMAPVSHVAPVREISIMIGVFWGAKVFGEAQMRRRITGSAFIVVGVAALAIR